MNYNPRPGYVDFNITQRVERRQTTSKNSGSIKNAAVKENVRARPRPAARKYNRKKTKRPGAFTSKIPTRFFITLASILAVAVFAYYALLFQGNDYVLRPDSDSGAFSEMYNYANGIFPSVAEKSSEIPLATSETFSWQNYTVKNGDSVSKIAADHSISMDAIIASNNLKNARNLHIGDVLRIPNMDGVPYTAVKGDSYPKIAASFGVPLEAILDANDVQDEKIESGGIIFIPGAKMKSEDLQLAMGELFIYPVNGRISSGYGWRKDPFTSGSRRFHSAVDFAAPTGTPVKAAMDGVVSASGFTATFGRYLILTHGGGYQTMYAHLNSSSATEGQKVKQGDKIAEVGNTGRSTGPHLHFAVYKNGRAVNPLEHMKF
ncbi:MAG: M23 family metallopeptidase [Spirochaetaceae bacterium]|jgi:murein DD-endopeptidase MepM/ murein hydrolase activator NlpD|nr:M23 family metallopeptidase [Spirochaetaceae bacterium]